MSRNRNRDEQEQPYNQPAQGNQVYGTSPQQVSPNTPNTSQTVSPVIIYAYPPHMAPGAPQAPQAPQQAQESNNNGGGGCPYKNSGPCGRPRKKRRLLKFLLFVGVIWFTATMAHRHGGKVAKMFFLGKVAKEMDLSYHQKHQLRGIFFDALHKNRQHRGTALKIRAEFMQLMAKPDLKQKELDAFLLKTTNKIQKIILSNSRHLYKARSVLTPGQRHILLARMQQMQRRHSRRHWRHHRRHYRHSFDYSSPESPKAAAPAKATKAVKDAKPAKAAKAAKAPAPAKAAPVNPAPMPW